MECPRPRWSFAAPTRCSALRASRPSSVKPAVPRSRHNFLEGEAMQTGIWGFFRPILSGHGARVLLPALAVMALGALLLRLSAGGGFAFAGILLSTAVLAAMMAAL